MADKKIRRLSQNENPLGISPMVTKVIVDHGNTINLYPESYNNLETKIANKYGVKSENVFLSAGLVEAFNILIKDMVATDENMLVSEVAFIAYRLMATMAGTNIKLIPVQDYHHNIEGHIKECNSKTKLIIIDNPSNPMGTIISHSKLAHLLDSVPSSTLVVVDEAYAEYVEDASYPNTLSLLGSYPNLIITRSFSKIYGLAGLRIGYTIASKEVIEEMKANQLPFTVNRMALIAASTALDDEGYVKECFSKNKEEKVRLYQGLKDLNIDVIYSQSNFLFLPFETSQARDNLYNHLFEAGIETTKTDGFGDDCGLRISIGLASDTIAVLDCLRGTDKKNK